MEPTFNYTTHSANLEKVVTRTDVDLRLMSEQVDTFPDVMMDKLVVQLSGFVLAGAPTDVHVSVDVPMNWREHFRMTVGARISKGSVTPIGRAVWRWAGNARMTTVGQFESVNRAICPHGMNEPAGNHLEWMVAQSVD